MFISTRLISIQVANNGPSNPKKTVSASLVLFLFTYFFISDVDYKPTQNLPIELSYGVIVDCGSSGSRAHIFSWKHGSVINEIQFVRDERSGRALNKHITPGLSFFKDEPDMASDYMEPIMAFINESIPRHKHIDTPVFFLATAGLRLLDDSTQEEILSDITRDLRAKYDFPKIESQVISGSFEGVYSWISINKDRLSDSLQSDKSYGMIEMGGASIQVTFELNPDIENSILKDLKNNDAISAFKNQQVKLELDSGHTIKLFAGTFLGLGVNSGREALVDLLVRDHLNISTTNLLDDTKPDEIEILLKDPCLTLGSTEIVLRPIALLQDSFYPIGYTLKEREETFKARLEGTGDFLHCLNLLEMALKIVKTEKLNCRPETKFCSISLLSTEFIPYSQYPFIGLSEMYFTTNAMMDSAGLFNRSNVWHETNRICSTQHNELLKIYSHLDVTHEDRILYECFKASWLLSILHDSGFRMPVDYDNFRTLDQMDEQVIDWTMGAIIADVANFNILN